jgi:hypothetical protein
MEDMVGLVEKPDKKRLLGKLGADGSILLKMNLNWWGLIQ